jgi:hypothetical protein
MEERNADDLKLSLYTGYDFNVEENTLKLKFDGDETKNADRLITTQFSCDLKGRRVSL